jgi:hypothetical protein
MNEQKSISLIACGILSKEINRIIKKRNLDVDIKFLDAKLHSDFGLLYESLSKTIEEKKREQKKIILIYGDVCLGFKNEMKELVKKHDISKIDALNCIDCLLGGKGELLKIDPDHEFYYLTPAWIEFNDMNEWSKEKARKLFSQLKGIILIDSLGNLDSYEEQIELISDFTNLEILEKKNLGLDSFEKLISESITRYARVG